MELDRVCRRLEAAAQATATEGELGAALFGHHSDRAASRDAHVIASALLLGPAARRQRCRAALLALAGLFADDGDEPTLPVEQDDEVAQVVDQLVGPLTAAPSAPPVRRVELVAA